MSHRLLVDSLMTSMAREHSEASGTAQSLAAATVRIDALSPASGHGPGAGAEEAIKQWKAEQVSLARRKKELSRQIRNETRKRCRLREKARKLSNDDLLKVLYARQSEAAKKESNVQAARRS